MPNYQARTEGDEIFRIPLSKKDSYDGLAIKVADYLSSAGTAPVDPSHLRFSTVHAQSGKPKAFIKRQQGVLMGTVLHGSGGYGGYGYAPAQAPDQLFYEVLEMSLTDLEQRRNVKLTWLSEGITKEEEFSLLVHKQSNFTELLSALQKKANLPDEILDQIRFYEAHTNKVYKILPLTHSVMALNEFMSIYAERIPEEERDMDKEKGDRLVYCFHFEKEPAKAHGTPFIFLLKGGEKMSETKERLAKRTGLKGKLLEKVQFAIVKGGQSYGRVTWVKEDDDVLTDKMAADDHLGLEHANRNRGNGVRYESLNIR